jgi:hypothetical protein
VLAPCKDFHGQRILTRGERLPKPRTQRPEGILFVAFRESDHPRNRSAQILPLPRIDLIEKVEILRIYASREE